MTGHGNNSLSHVLILQKLSFYVEIAKPVDDLLNEKFINNVHMN